MDVWEKYQAYHAVDGQSRNELLVDRLHPNDKGHEIVAKLIADVIATPASASR